MARGKGRSFTGGYRGGQGSSSSRKPSGGPRRPLLTHFLCLPLVTDISKPQLEESIAKLLESVSTDSMNTNESGFSLSPKAVRPLGTLHLTLGVMSLQSEERLKASIEFLEGLDISKMLHEVTNSEDAVPPEPVAPIKISLTSLVSLHPSKNTSILYVPPKDPTKRLQPFCANLRDIFTKQGLLLPDDRPLKLHATVVNTIYARPGGRSAFRTGRVNSGSLGEATGRKPEPESNSFEKESTAINDGSDAKSGDVEVFEQGNSSNQARDTRGSLRFDATALLEVFKDFVWTRDFRIEKLAICKMGAKKTVDRSGKIVGEEYEEVASVALPG